MIVCFRFKRVRRLLHRYVMPGLCAATIAFAGCVAQVVTTPDARDATAASGQPNVAERETAGERYCGSAQDYHVCTATETASLADAERHCIEHPNEHPFECPGSPGGSSEAIRSCAGRSTLGCVSMWATLILLGGILSSGGAL